MEESGRLATTMNGESRATHVGGTVGRQIQACGGNIARPRQPLQRQHLTDPRYSSRTAIMLV
jgi:hypothetical protein